MRAGVAVATALLAALGTTGLVIAASMPPPLVSVAELDQHKARWYGRTVKVQGLLEQEAPWDPHSANQFTLSSRAPGVEQNGAGAAWPSNVLIAYDEAFARRASPFLGKRIVVTGEFVETCPQPQRRARRMLWRA
jgi:hypothetical protein